MTKNDDAKSPQGLDRIAGTAHDVGGFLKFAVLRFYNDNCFQTAASLTYTALLALVPLMTIGFAIFSAFPAFGTLRERAQQLIFKNLVPTVGDAILEYLGRFMANAGQLTAFGIIGLAVSAVLLLSTIEGSFSAIWRVHEPRSLITRFLSFWAILTLAPMLFGASLSLSSSLLTYMHLAHLDLERLTSPLAGVAVLMPGILEFFGFALLYLIIPNRMVRWQDAAVGGLVAALLLEVSKAGFGWYLTSFPAYQTIYGALSTVPIFLLWLYIAWSTVLVGAEVAAALPEWRAGKILQVGPEGLLPGQRLALALAVLHELLHASKLGVGMRRRTLLHRVPVGATMIEGMLVQLREAHWVARTTRDAWVCTRDLSEATLFDLMRALGIGLRGPVRSSIDGLVAPWQERCAQLLEASEAASRDILAVSLKELLESAGEEERGTVPLRARRGT
ncbi:MAG TPA: YihY family inner membrane protein [Azospirillaceae bacterium]|nr:YihY family inner membrane protein [Azospirillaceae bacterium]